MYSSLTLVLDVQILGVLRVLLTLSLRLLASLLVLLPAVGHALSFLFILSSLLLGMLFWFT